MKDLKKLWAFIRKEIRHILRDKRTLLILFGIPVVQVILFGFAITTDLNEAPVSINDQAKDNVTLEIRNALLSSGYFRLVSDLESPGQVEKAFRKGETRMVIEFAPDFYHNMLTGQGAQIFLAADASDPNVANMLVAYASGIILKYQQQQLETAGTLPGITSEVRMYFNPAMKSVFMFVPGVMTVILMLISAMMTSIAITREKEQGTMEVLLVSPVRPAQIILGKVITYFLLALINAITIVVLGYLVFGMPVMGSLWLLTVETMLFIIVSLSLGILVSTVAKTQQVALMISLIAFMLPTIMLSGFIFPIENMPKLLQGISLIIPARWFLVIIKDIMLKGAGIAFFWKETLILGVMAVILLSVSIKKLKIRLQ